MEFSPSGDGLDALISVSYLERKEIKDKIFVDKEQKAGRLASAKEKDRAQFKSDLLYGKSVRGYATDNTIYLKIHHNRYFGRNARLKSGGNYDFFTGDSPGYTLEVRFDRNEKELKSEVSRVLREDGFGCLSSEMSLHGHKSEEYPSEDGAKETLVNLCSKINECIDLLADTMIKKPVPSKVADETTEYVEPPIERTHYKPKVESKPETKQRVERTLCNDGSCGLNRQGVVHESHDVIQNREIQDPCNDPKCAMNRMGISHDKHDLVEVGKNIIKEKKDARKTELDYPFHNEKYCLLCGTHRKKGKFHSLHNRHMQKKRKYWVCGLCSSGKDKKTIPGLLRQFIEMRMPMQNVIAEKGKWECAVCKQIFLDHDRYLAHHYSSHS